MALLLIHILLLANIFADEIFAWNGPYYSPAGLWQTPHSLHHPNLMIPPPGYFPSPHHYSYTEVKTPHYHYYYYSPVLKPGSYDRPEMPPAYPTTKVTPAVYSTTEVNPGVYSTTKVTPAVYSTTEMNPAVYSTTEVNPGVYSTTEVNPGVYSTTKVTPGVYSTTEVNPGVYSTTQVNPIVDYKSDFGVQSSQGLFIPNKNEERHEVRIPSTVSNPDFVNNWSSPPIRRPAITPLFMKKKPLFQPVATPLYSTPNVIRSEDSVYPTENSRAPSYKIYVLKKRPLTKPEDLPEVLASPSTNIVREDDEEENLPPSLVKERTSTEATTSFGTLPAAFTNGATVSPRLNDYPTVPPPVFIFQQPQPIFPANLLPSDSVSDLSSSDPAFSAYNNPTPKQSRTTFSEENTNCGTPKNIIVYSSPKLIPYPTVSNDFGGIPSVRAPAITQPPPYPEVFPPSDSVSDISSNDFSTSVLSSLSTPSPDSTMSDESTSSGEILFQPDENLKPSTLQNSLDEKPNLIFEAPGHDIPS